MYSPRIQDEQLKRLYILSKKFSLPMAKIVRTAIAEFLLKHEMLLNEKVGGIAQPEAKNASKGR